MKFISAHIENFGKLHNYDVVFNDGANLICQKNGWGKSTFAAFIKVMFYGFDGERKHSLEENERKRYMPWQGGVYGGSLSFESEGVNYTITRIFKDKEANDEFELRFLDTNMISNDYSKDIGKEIFKIDRDSFIRTIFIGQSESATKQTDDINAKIGNLADNTNDINNYETAYAKISEKMNSITPKRATGSIAKRKTIIAQEEIVINSGAGIIESIEKLQGMIDSEQADLEILLSQNKENSQAVKKRSQMQKLLGKKDEWEHLKEKVLLTKEELDKTKSFFPDKIPSKEEIKNTIADCNEYSRYREKVIENTLDNAELSKYRALFEKFDGKIISDDKISDLFAKSIKYREYRQEQLSNKLSDAENKKYEKLSEEFLDETQTVNQMLSMWTEKNTKKATVTSNNVALSALRATLNNSQQNNIPLLMVLGGIILLIGIALCLFAPVVIGIVVAIIGVILLIVGVVNKKEKPNANSSPEIDELINTIANDEEFVKNAESQIQKYLEKHGKAYDEYSVYSSLQDINNDYLEYLRLEKNAKLWAENDTTEESKALYDEICSVLSLYNYDCDEATLNDSIHRLKSDLSAFISLDKKYAVFNDANRKSQDIYSKIKEFLDELGFEIKTNLLEQLLEISEKADGYENARMAFLGAGDDLKEFENNVDVDAMNALPKIDDELTLEQLHSRGDEIAEKIEESRRVIVGYYKQLDSLNESYDEYIDAKNNLEDLYAEQKREQTMFDYLSVVQKKLSLAKEEITSKYSKPILNSFNKYYEMIVEDNDNTFYLDANTNITVSEWGKQRDIVTQSQGYRDLISICLRIALVDAMYKEEKPVLILDDPFTNLDDEKMEKAVKFIGELAKNYQLLYFSCSNHRIQ